MTLLCMIAIRAYSPDEARDDRGRWTGDQSITPGEGSYKAWVGPKGEQHVFSDDREHAYNPPPGVKIRRTESGDGLDEFDANITQIQKLGYARVIRQAPENGGPAQGIVHYWPKAPGSADAARHALLSLKMPLGSRIGIDKTLGLSMTRPAYEEYNSPSAAMASIMKDVKPALRKAA